MTVFNLSNITIGDTFDTWFVSSNDAIDSLNTILILDAQADTDRGLEETYRNGGVVIMGITHADGLGFNAQGQIGLSFSGVTIGTRTAVDDVILLIQPDGTVKGVQGINMLPPQVDKDIHFTGDIAFSGDLDFISSGTVNLQVDTAFRDKELELAVNFDDSLEFATVLSPVDDEAVYFIDGNVITDFSTFDPVTDEFIGTGNVLSTSDPVIIVTDFVFSTTGDAFQEFTDSGATVGGRYALVNVTGVTRGQGLIDHSSTKSPPARQTSPLVASGAGLVVLTNNTSATPAGGSAGEKLWTWLWNGTSADAAWTSSEHIQIVAAKSFIGASFISPTDYVARLAQSTFIFDRYTYDGATSGFALHYNKTADTFSIGPFTSSTTFNGGIQFNRDTTITAITSGVASNFNADMLDGAHGATFGGTANEVPITGTDGLIDSTFLPGSGRIEEIITQTSHGLATGACVRRDATLDFTPAIATGEGTATAVGIVSEVIDVNTFRLTYYGVVDTPDIYGFSLGLGYGGITIAVNEGDIYYLSESITGGISSAKPAISTSITKAMFVALGEQKILITNNNARPAPTGDTIDVSSVVPVGTISHVGNINIGANTDFLTCDGKVYDSVAYPDLRTAIQGQFFVGGVGTGGESSIVILGADSETRNFAVGQAFDITYNADATTATFTIGSVVGISTGVQLGLSGPLNGTSTDFYDDVEVRGNGVYFLTPDLRSRGLVGDGDPDGASNATEGDFDHGDLVDAGGGGGAIENEFEITKDTFETRTLTISNLGGAAATSSTAHAILPNGTYIIWAGGNCRGVPTLTVNGESKKPNGPTEGSYYCIPYIVEVTNNQIVMTNSGDLYIEQVAGFKIRGASDTADLDLGTNEYFDEILYDGSFGSGMAGSNPIFSFDATNLRAGTYKVDINVSYLTDITITATTDIDSKSHSIGTTANAGNDATSKDHASSIIIKVDANGVISFAVTAPAGSGNFTLRAVTGIRIGA